MWFKQGSIDRLLLLYICERFDRLLDSLLNRRRYRGVLEGRGRREVGGCLGIEREPETLRGFVLEILPWWRMRKRFLIVFPCT